MFGDGDEKRRLEHRHWGDDGFIQWDVIAVTLVHLGANGWIRQVEVADLLKTADLNAEGTVVCLPDEFRTVDTVVGPPEGEVVRPTCEPTSHGMEPLEPCWCEYRFGVSETFDDEMVPSAAGDPLVEWREAHCGDGFEHEGLSVAMNDEPHVAVLRLSGTLNRDGL